MGPGVGPDDDIGGACQRQCAVWGIHPACVTDIHPIVVAAQADGEGAGIGVGAVAGHGEIVVGRRGLLTEGGVGDVPRAADVFCHALIAGDANDEVRGVDDGVGRVGAEPVKAIGGKPFGARSGRRCDTHLDRRRGDRRGAAGVGNGGTGATGVDHQRVEVTVVADRDLVGGGEACRAARERLERDSISHARCVGADRHPGAAHRDGAVGAVAGKPERGRAGSLVEPEIVGEGQITVLDRVAAGLGEERLGLRARAEVDRLIRRAAGENGVERGRGNFLGSDVGQPVAGHAPRTDSAGTRGPGPCSVVRHRLGLNGHRRPEDQGRSHNANPDRRSTCSLPRHKHLC